MNVLLPDDHRVQIANTKDLFRIMQSILMRENTLERMEQHTWVIGIGPDWFIENIELVGKGIGHIKPVDVFSVPLQKRCTRIILARNSDNLEPTELDKAWTAQISAAGSINEVLVLDHMLFNEADYKSFL